MAQISRIRRVRAGDHCLMKYGFLKLTWIRLLPQSATMILPLVSTATPVGALNWPFPSPWEPNLNRNSPSALYTCRKNNWPVTCLSHRTSFCDRKNDYFFKQQQETNVLACSLNLNSAALPFSNVIVSSSHTLTEWLWKSVTTISFLLFTATKWGPGISRGNKRGKKRGKMSHIVFFNARQEVPHYFWAGLKTYNTATTRRLIDVRECVRQDRSWAAVWNKKKKKEQGFVTLMGETFTYWKQGQIY